MSREPIEYYRGFLARDRNTLTTPLSVEECLEVDIAARVHWGRMLLGEGFLVQKLVEPGVWSYLFIPLAARHG